MLNFEIQIPSRTKVILQTKAFKQQTSVMHLNHVHMHPFHVEHAGQDLAATEVGEAEEVYHEEEQQQFASEDQEQGPELEQELTNFVNTQGKHRCMINPSSLYI